MPYLPALFVLLGILLTWPLGLAKAQMPSTLINGAQVIVGHVNYCETTGATDAYLCPLLEPLAEYNVGTVYTFKAHLANTGPASLNINSIGVVPLKKVQGGVLTDLSDNDIRVGQIVEVSYDGTHMQMLSPLGNSPQTGAGTYNVIDYGAKGDCDADDTAAIQSVLNLFSGQTKTGTVFFPATNACYKITAPLTYVGNPSVGVTMLGATRSSRGPWGARLDWYGAAGGIMIDWKGANNSVIKNLGLNGRNLAKEGIRILWHDALDIPSSNNTLESLVITGMTGVDSACINCGSDPDTINLQADSLYVHEVTCYGNFATDTSYYGIVTGTANSKNFYVTQSFFAGLRYGIVQGYNPASGFGGGSGFFVMTSTYFDSNWIADLHVSTGSMSCRGCGSEESRMLAVGTVGANPGSLTIQDSYWHVTTDASDMLINFPGQIVLINNSFTNLRNNATAGLRVQGAQPFNHFESGVIISMNNSYANTVGDYAPLYDGSGVHVANRTVPQNSWSQGDHTFTPGVPGGWRFLKNLAHAPQAQHDTDVMSLALIPDFLTARDTVLTRDGAAGVAALKHGTNPMAWRVYGTTTGNKFAELRHDGTNPILDSSSGRLKLGATAAGTQALMWNVDPTACTGNGGALTVSAGEIVCSTDDGGAGGGGVALGDSPTWTGVHTFTNTPLKLHQPGSATLELRDTDGPGHWRLRAGNYADQGVIGVSNHVLILEYNMDGALAQYPQFYENWEPRFTGELPPAGKLERSWGFYSIDKLVQYRPMHFYIDLNTNDADLQWRVEQFRVVGKFGTGGGDETLYVDTTTGVVNTKTLRVGSWSRSTPYPFVVGGPTLNSAGAAFMQTLANNEIAVYIAPTAPVATTYWLSAEASASTAGIVKFRNSGAGGSQLDLQAGTTGDAWTTYSTSTGVISMGIDTSDGGKYKLSNSTVLGTSDRFSVDPATGNTVVFGRMTLLGGAIDPDSIITASAAVTDPAPATYTAGASFQRSVALTATNAERVVGDPLSAPLPPATLRIPAILWGWMPRGRMAGRMW